jgi:O-antigen/teichoic acid export membrane protein
MSIYKSVAKNYAANSVGLGLRFLEQIAMVPLFISFWGIAKYADWILITAFSSFFSMVDMGLNTVAANEFVIKYQQKDYFICLKLWVNNFLFLTVLSVAIILLSVIIASTTGFQGILQTSVFSGAETSFIFVLLLVKVFLAMYSGAYHGIFRSVSRTHLSTMIENSISFFEILILFVGIWLGIPILIVVTAYLIPMCVGIVYKHIYVQRWFKLRFSFKLVDISLLKSFVKPSVAFMLMPLGYAFSNQGMMFVVNAFLGHVVLVMFTTIRTLVNFLRALMNLLNNSIWPEISVAYGKRDLSTISILYRRSFIITFALSLFCITLLILFGEPAYMIWTKHTVSFNAVFFYGMLAVLLASCLWGITSTIPLATNTHASFSLAFVITQLAGAGITCLALAIYPDLVIVPVMLFIAEAFLLWFAMKDVLRLLHIDFSVFRKEIPHEILFMIKKLALK